ncbi:rhamnulokinase [Microbacterium sp. A82]|uniref:rhamnulokinase n=1 Tax=Microbacterium sp. A82 TaxID=3450452 RepID=UPI003F3A446E
MARRRKRGVTPSFAALDFGATSGRVIVGTLTDGHVQMREVGRFANTPVIVSGRMHWDTLSLWNGAMTHLREAVRETPGLLSVATDSWGVDYGLFRRGRMLGNPVHYRDERTLSQVDRVHSRMSEAQIYARAGIQILPINTIYQLAADAEDGLLDVADTALLTPDLFSFWLSGERVAERTIASTTSLMSARTGEWDGSLLDTVGIDRALLPPIVASGTRLGQVTTEVAEGLGASLDVVTVAAHDTASAVVAIPMSEDGAAFVSCGTWGLVGVERVEPVLTEQARIAGFTNESGTDGRHLIMRNGMGLWMLSESMRLWERERGSIDLGALIAAAEAVELEVSVVDVDDAVFQTPGDMPARIATWCAERGLRVPQGMAEIARCIIESLAQAFADAAAEAAELTGQRLTQINMVGGGSRNALLCRRTAERADVPVLAGPDEATALGSILVQARSMGELDGTLEDLRVVATRTVSPKRYAPR